MKAPRALRYSGAHSSLFHASQRLSGSVPRKAFESEEVVRALAATPTMSENRSTKKFVTRRRFLQAADTHLTSIRIRVVWGVQMLILWS